MPLPKLMSSVLRRHPVELKATKDNAHKDDQLFRTGVLSVGYSPDGSNVVSSGLDGTIKVWDAINFRPHVESEWEEFEKTDVWGEIKKRWRNKITGHEQSVKPSGSMCPPMNPGRSKSGTQVSKIGISNGRSMRLSHPLTLVCRLPGFDHAEGERAQRHNQLCRLRSRREDDRVRLLWWHDQSLGCDILVSRRSSIVQS
jgi:hypothetical protein